MADPDVPHARRVLIVHAIGSAAFAVSAAAPDGEGTGPGDGPLPLDAAQARQTFARSLGWLLTGITSGRPG